MKNFPTELIAKAKEAKSAKELLALAKTNNIEITEEEAKTYFDQLNANGAVTDEELDLVAGGGCGDDEVTFEPGEIVDLKMPCPDCKCYMGIYQKDDGIGGCFVTCRRCHKPIWFADTHGSIEKMFLGSPI